MLSNKTLLFVCTILILRSADVYAHKDKDSAAFSLLMIDFDKGYQDLNIRGFEMDYRKNLKNIPPLDSIEQQIAFFNKVRKNLSAVRYDRLPRQYKINYDQLAYEVKLNLERLGLERAYRSSAHSDIPTDGLHSMDPACYQYYIHYFTSVDISPDELYRFGEKEVARVHSEISAIRRQTGYENDSAGFYQYLQSPAFYLTDKKEILAEYDSIKATVYKNIGMLFSDTAIPDVAFMEWPKADRFTPPGYYSSQADNAYGTAVFFFNFYDGRHNKRVMDWLFMHEGVPGHHYQYSLRQKLAAQPAFKALFYYPGNTEGWGAYVEYMGHDIGLYQDPWSYLGKWEWDLVRSTRILIDVGIHHLGWTKEQAMDCWRRNIPGQDAIAEREVVRCTNWPAQALSYKVGAEKIMEIRDKLKKKQGENFDLRKFHAEYLSYGIMPVEVIEKDMLRD